MRDGREGERVHHNLELGVVAVVWDQWDAPDRRLKYQTSRIVARRKLATPCDMDLGGASGRSGGAVVEQRNRLGGCCPILLIRILHRATNTTRG